MRKARFKRLGILIAVLFCLFQIKSYASIPSPSTDYYLDELGILDEATKENICLLYTSDAADDTR